MVRGGQLCNRLLSISAFVANSIEHNYPMICSSFDDYYDKFASINKSSSPYNIRFLKSKHYVQKLFIKFLYKYISMFPKSAERLGLIIYPGNENINIPGFIEKAIKNKLFVQGWPYWDVNNFIKHSNEIRNIFTPKQEYFDCVAAFLDKLDPSYTALVGVHVRRGDYKNYINGRFYFSTETYLNKMQELNLELISLNKKPIFIICSDEIFAADQNQDFPYVFSSLDDVSDLILLSKCHYIFGPPSTYSMWASFYGNVPYNNFFSEDEILKVEDFSPIIAPSTYANGRVLKDVYERYST